MTDYYYNYIEKNENLLSIIYDFLNKKEIIKKYHESQGRYSHLGIEENILINKDYKINIQVSNVIMATISLKENKSIIVWNKWSEPFAEEEPITKFEHFRKPYFIQVMKINKIINNDTEINFLYQLKHDDTFINAKVKNISYENDYVFALDYYNEFSEDSEKNKERNEIEYNYNFLRNLKYFPKLNDYIQEIADYILIGKELSQGTKDLMLLYSDINEKMISDFEVLRFNMNDFNYEVNKIISNKSKKITKKI